MSRHNDTLFRYINSISPLSLAVFDKLHSLGEQVTFEKGHYFASEGRLEENFGILIDGIVRTFYRTASGEEYIKSFGIPFSFIGGFSALITGKKNKINVQTLTECTILSINYNELSKLYTNFPEVETLARRLTESLFIAKENRELELISLNAEKRYLQFREQFPELESVVPQYHIASYLGISATQLSRIRKNLGL